MNKRLAAIALFVLFYIQGISQNSKPLAKSTSNTNTTTQKTVDTTGGLAIKLCKLLIQQNKAAALKYARLDDDNAKKDVGNFIDFIKQLKDNTDPKVQAFLLRIMKLNWKVNKESIRLSPNWGGPLLRESIIELCGIEDVEQTIAVSFMYYNG